MPNKTIYLSDEADAILRKLKKLKKTKSDESMSAFTSRAIVALAERENGKQESQ